MKKVLTLSPDTFLWTNEQEGIVYDSKHCKSFRFEMTSPVLDLCRRLLEYDNLYSVEYDNATAVPDVIAFIDGVVSSGAGVIHEKCKPVISLPPLLNIQHDIDMQKKRDFEYQDYALRYLIRIVIYTGGGCPENIFFQQLEYPVASKDVLDYSELSSFIKGVISPYLTEISIVFSDISGYEDLCGLLEFLDGLDRDITLCIRAEEYVGDVQSILEKYQKLRVQLLYAPGYRHRYPVPTVGNIRYLFLIASEVDYRNAEELSSQYQDCDIRLIPVFSGNNMEFFRNNVFLSREDILSSNLNRRGVFMHQVLNTNYFGTLYVMPDRNVFSDVTAPALGSMSDSIYCLILKELSENHSWRKIRNTGECKECLYRYLCPSPGAYEKLMNVKCICTDK